MEQENSKSLFMLGSLGYTAMLSLYPMRQNKPIDEHQKTNPKPNILLIVANDMGYSDCGAFGREI